MAFASGPAATAAPPPSPPFPVPRNLPFHFPATGSQTSTLISESLDGASVACTRQNAGRSANLGKSPAATLSAKVILARGTGTLFNPTQVVTAPIGMVAKSRLATTNNFISDSSSSTVLRLLCGAG